MGNGASVILVKVNAGTPVPTFTIFTCSETWQLAVFIQPNTVRYLPVRFAQPITFMVCVMVIVSWSSK